MAQGKKTGGRNWKQGQSGNPNGRPRESWAETLRFVGEITDTKTGKSYKELVARKLWEQAIKGDLSAIKAIMDRTDGRPSQSVDVTPKRLPIPILGGIEDPIIAEKYRLFLKQEGITDLWVTQD